MRLYLHNSDATAKTFNQIQNGLSVLSSKCKMIPHEERRIQMKKKAYLWSILKAYLKHIYLLSSCFI